MLLKNRRRLFATVRAWALLQLAMTTSLLALGGPGTALQFDGVDDALLVTNVSGLSTGNSPHTVEMWVNVAALPSPRSWLLLLGNGGINSSARFYRLKLP